MALQKLNERLKKILLNYIRENNTSFKDLKEKFKSTDYQEIIDVVSYYECIGRIKVDTKTGSINFQKEESTNFDDLVDEFNLNSDNTKNEKDPICKKNNIINNSQTDSKFREMIKICRELKTFRRYQLIKKLKWGKESNASEIIENYLTILLENNQIQDCSPSHQVNDTYRFIELPTKEKEDKPKESKPKTEPITNSNNIEAKIEWVICPHCGLKQKYIRRSSKRNHKYCLSKEKGGCSKHFKIDSNPINEEKSSEEKVKETLQLKLHEIDKQILKCFRDESTGEYVEQTQNDILSKIKVNKSTISRHLKHLLSLGLLTINEAIGIPFAKNYYTINEKIKEIRLPQSESELQTTVDKSKKLSTHDIIAVQCHDVKMSIPIKHGFIPDSAFVRKSKMNNWKYGYTAPINGIIFQCNEKNIFFWMYGIGLNTDLCYNNILEKSFAVKSMFEKAYGLTLANPKCIETDIETHYVGFEGSAKDFHKLQLAWTDKSHPKALETNDKKFVDDLIGLRNEVINLQHKNDEIKTELNNLKNQQPDPSLNFIESIRNDFVKSLQQQFSSMKSEIKSELKTELIPAISQAFTEAIKQLATQQQPQDKPGPAPDQLFL